MQLHYYYDLYQTSWIKLLINVCKVLPLNEIYNMERILIMALLRNGCRQKMTTGLLLFVYGPFSSFLLPSTTNSEDKDGVGL